jgi:hypothetical protein
MSLGLVTHLLDFVISHLAPPERCFFGLPAQLISKVSLPPIFACASQIFSHFTVSRERYATYPAPPHRKAAIYLTCQAQEAGRAKEAPLTSTKAISLELAVAITMKLVAREGFL